MLVIFQQQPSTSSFCFSPAVSYIFISQTSFTVFAPHLGTWYLNIRVLLFFFFSTRSKLRKVLSIKAGQKWLLAIIIFATLEGFLSLLTPRGIQRNIGQLLQEQHKLCASLKSGLCPLIFICVKRKSCCLSVTSVVLQSHAAPPKCPENHGVCLHGADSVRCLATLHHTDPCFWGLPSWLGLASTNVPLFPRQDRRSSVSPSHWRLESDYSSGWWQGCSQAMRYRASFSGTQQQSCFFSSILCFLKWSSLIMKKKKKKKRTDLPDNQDVRGQE